MPPLEHPIKPHPFTTHEQLKDADDFELLPISAFET